MVSRESEDFLIMKTKISVGDLFVCKSLISKTWRKFLVIDIAPKNLFEDKVEVVYINMLSFKRESNFVYPIWDDSLEHSGWCLIKRLS